MLFTLNAPTAYPSSYALANISLVVTKGMITSLSQAVYQVSLLI
jgi:hypothetical protein